MCFVSSECLRLFASIMVHMLSPQKGRSEKSVVSFKKCFSQIRSISTKAIAATYSTSVDESVTLCRLLFSLKVEVS